MDRKGEGTREEVTAWAVAYLKRSADAITIARTPEGKFVALNLYSDAVRAHYLGVGYVFVSEVRHGVGVALLDVGAVAIEGDSAADIDQVALEVARRFTPDAEPKLRAVMQVAVIEAIKGVLNATR
jgi:hypothetical protein